MRDSKIINHMCVAQTCCRACPIGKDAHRLALDCRQYIEIFPESAVKLAQIWSEKNNA